MLKENNILIVSNEPWGDTWYSKHNYAWELSKNNVVYFINPPVPFHPFNFFKNNIETKNIKKDLTVLTYKNVLPVRIEFLRKINEWYILRKLKNHLNAIKLYDIIFWTFDPIRLTNPKYLKPKTIILQMVDKYQFNKKAEFIISKNADFIFCVAEEIAENYRPLNKNVFVIPHAIPEDEFLPLKTEFKEPLTAVYVGNIDVRIDFEFLKYQIEKFPDITFEFVGKLIIDNLETYGIFDCRYTNVKLQGEQPFKQLKYFIQKSDFCFLFKDTNHLGNSISSHKMLQYFAQGKPIFSTKLSQYEIIKDLLFMENDKSKMAELIENFIKNGDTKGANVKRIAYAKTHSFQNILKQIKHIIDGK